MWTRQGTKQLEAGACLGQDMLGCNIAAAPTQQVSHTLEEAKSLFADAMSQAGAGHDMLSNLPTSNSYPVHQVGESLKRKGVILNEPESSTSSDPVLRPRMGDVEEEAERFRDRDVSWILSRQDSRKRKMQLGCDSALDFSSYEVQMLSSNDIQDLLVEGARLGVFGQAEVTSLEAGSSVEAASVRAPATDGEMDIPLTPEIMQNHRGRSPSADHTSSSPESPGVNPSPPGKNQTQQGELMRDEDTHRSNPPPNGQHMPKMKGGANIVQDEREQVTKKGRNKAPNTKEKTTTKRKRKYMPKIRAEKARASPAKKPRTSKESSTPVNATPPIEEIPEVMLNPSLLQMKSFARINQRYPKLRKRSRKLAPAISKNFPAGENPPPVVRDIAHSADFWRFLQASLFVDQSIKLGETAPSPTENLPRAGRDGSSNGSLFTHLSTEVGMPEFNQGPQVHVDGNLRTPRRSTSPPVVEEILNQSSVEDPPVDPFLSTCRNLTLEMPPSSPPSPHGAERSDAANVWDSFEIESPALSVRRSLTFDTPQLEVEHVEPWLQKCHMNLLNYQAPVVEQAVEIIDPTERSRERALQMVAYDDGSKKMVVYKKNPGSRRIKFKPKVNLDFSTVRMFKMLTIKSTAADEAGAAQEKDSWEQARQQWQRRALRFIAIMREVQGSRAFSRWKGSVVDSVGGAFLTQNVSDFLSSNAFISLRARFPARKRTGAPQEGTERIITPPAKEQPTPVEKESATIPCPERATIVELKKQQMEVEQRQEEESESVATLLNSANENKNNTCLELSETDIEMLRTALNECHILPKDASNHAVVKRPAAVVNHEETNPLTRPMLAILSKKEEQVVIKQTKESNEDVQEIENIITSGCSVQSHLGAMEVEATILFQKEELYPNPANGIAIPMNHSEKFLSSESVDDEPQIQANTESVEVQKTLQVDCVIELPRVEEALLPVEELDSEDELGSASAWKGKLASAVIEEKFASVVAESVTSLTEVGREKVLAATLRQVLGKEHTTREIGLGSKVLKSFKLRPARAALRKGSDNYRYRHNVSFRLLSGEARASWEAGFVMKCQKAKWEPLRAAILADESYCRDPLTKDCVDWAAVQKASVHEVADVIKNRGQHNALAGRMKAFLDRVHRDQNGSIDLEWIRKLPPEDAKAFLMSFRGVGLKSVECIRLLTLHHPSFPVDTNVGRILVRLGWVPLEPLPEETQLHLLELYPIQSQIQQYIWPRLCTLDQETLYELHYQLITFGKVFCTKSKPNCNACPLRSECKHYASSYASAKLLLKWPAKQEKQSRMLALQGSTSSSAETEATQYSTLTQGHCIPIIVESCIPIIEEPRSPEPNPDSIPDIEELPFNVEFDTRHRLVETDSGSSSSRFSEVTGEVCSFLDLKQTLLDLNCEPEPDTVVVPPAGTEMLQPQVLKKGPTEGDCTEVALDRTQVTVEGGEEEPASQGVTDECINHLPSQELILLPPQSSLAPAPKLKNVQRLRTVHFVYELPDNHPLLFEMDKREPDDPCFYLLAIWSPDEVPATIPKINDDDASNPFASCQDNDPEQTVRGTLLIPCKTAMRGYFPLNGTYFQVNEVFADHASSVQPIDVPRTLLWSLRRRFVYFSTAVSNLFKDFKSVSGLNGTDMSQEEIQCCFQKGYVCLRAFDVATRQPKILAPRLHQSGAKIVKAPAPRKDRGRAGKTSTSDKPRKRSTKKSTSEAPLMETTMAHEGLESNQLAQASCEHESATPQTSLRN